MLRQVIPPTLVRALRLAPLVLLLLPIQTANAAASPFASAMQSAAASRQVPLPVIEATAYVNTRWEWIGTPSHDGGVGPMNVQPSQIGLASSLSGHTEVQIDGDLAANLDAGAALLAHYHTSGTDVASWRTAVATTQGSLVAAEIFNVLRSGASRTTSTGETITLAPQTVASGGGGLASVDGPAAAATASPDYPSASWIPADPSNYSTANRTHDYPIDMIVIHDIEGSASSAIQDFQTPNFAASAHYVVGYDGAVTQMVREHDIAWHAGNWDYNTRSIGIEHAGFAYTSGLYTTAEYNASAALAASICSRYGVPMDRTHVIGHYQVPDPNNPGLYGGSDHHTDPGPYWDWTYYMATAQADAAALPSPPHLMPDPVATNTSTGVTVTWQPARTCRKPVTGYVVTGQPGNLSQTLPATATSATFSNLQLGTAYTFTVTAQNADGQDSQATNSAIPGACTAASMTASPASPQTAGTSIQLSATASTCANPRYEFWMLPPGGVWTDVQPYSTSSTYSWSTTGIASGTYSFGVWVQDSSSPGAQSDSAGRFDARFGIDYTLNAAPCSATNVTVSPPSYAAPGSVVTLTASATGCTNPLYEFWLQNPSGIWSLVAPYSTSATYTWRTAGQPSGAYRFSVWTRDAASAGVSGTSPNTYDSFSAFPYVLTYGCPSMTASASPASTATVGSPVTISASATGCSNPRYEIWLLPPGGTWQLLNPYTASGTFTWNTSGRPAGSYRFSVWARDAASSASYDTFSAFQYTLTVAACTGMNATSSPSGSAGVGTTVVITGAASGCPQPQYEFWLLPPGGTWQLLNPYTASGTFTWNTLGRPAGSYRFSVWARDAASSASYDTFSAFQYMLTVAACTGMNATSSPSGSAGVGTTVVITGAASGCPQPQYEFWLLPPGGTWQLARSYSSTATFSWNTTGRLAGSYRFSVWARDASSGASYDSFNAFNYTLAITPCTGMTATASPANSATVGTTVTITANATGCSNPQFEFWVWPPGGPWMLVQGYGPSATLTWTTTGKPAGTYRFSVWVHDSSSNASYDAFQAFNYNLT